MTFKECCRGIAVASSLLGLCGHAGAQAPVSSFADASRQQFYGPLRARDLTPFGYLRLDVRPAFTDEIAPGHWAIETEIGYQNTWAISDPVQHYLASLPDRRDLTAQNAADIRALPGENFLVDLELAELDLTLHRQFTADWGAYLVVSAATYGGGALDGVIEQVHSAFGMSQMGRHGVERNQMNIVMDLDSVQYALLDSHSRSGLLDPTVGVRYSGLRLPAPWLAVLEAAIKVPVAGERPFLSTGRTDLGIQASFSRRGANHALYGSLAVVDYAGSDSELQPGSRIIPTIVLGIESHLTPRWHSIVQAYASQSAYGADETHLDELTSNKYLLSLGLRYHRGAHLFSFAVTENIANMDNTPDVGFQLGWAYRTQPQSPLPVIDEP